MMTEATVVEAEPTTQAVAVATPKPTHMDLWSPAELQAQIDHEVAMRKVLVNYYKSEMRPGLHYYSRKDLRRGEGEEERRDDGRDDKPSLKKEGALNLCSLLKVRPAAPETIERWDPDGHYTVRTLVKLVSLRTGDIVGEGEGLCSTRESKYAWRWLPEWELPEEERTGLKRRRVKIRKGPRQGQTFTLYRTPNSDLADQYNTCLKISYKRGLVAAALTLPLVSELFTQDIEDQAPDESEEPSDEERGVTEPEGTGSQSVSGAGARRPRPTAPPAATATPPTPTPEQVERMGKSEIKTRVVAQLQALAPDDAEMRLNMAQTCFGASITTPAKLEELGLTPLRAGYVKLLAMQREEPPPAEEPTPEVVEAEVEPAPEPEAEAHLGALREERAEAARAPAAAPESPAPSVSGTDTEPGSPAGARLPTGAPPLRLDGGYVSQLTIAAARAWAKELGQTDLLEDLMTICPGWRDTPQVTSAQYARYCTAVQTAADQPTAEAAHEEASF